MGQWLDFTHRNSEFEDRDGNLLGAGWLEIELAGDGDRFEIESVRYVVPSPGYWGAETLKPVPTHISDFIADWLLADLAKGAGSSVRQAYEAALIESDAPDNRAEDRADYERDFWRQAAE